MPETSHQNLQMGYDSVGCWTLGRPDLFTSIGMSNSVDGKIAAHMSCNKHYFLHQGAEIVRQYNFGIMVAGLLSRSRMCTMLR